ncbi:MAG: hypothetical protein ACRDTT_35660 [Pseudonocardiaceae bacterium]
MPEADHLGKGLPDERWTVEAVADRTAQLAAVHVVEWDTVQQHLAFVGVDEPARKHGE